MIDLEQNLKTAVAHHQAGRKLEARLIYKLVLEQDPEEPDALHLLGQLCFDDGQIQFAADLIERAIKGRPNATDFHTDLARIYRQMGRHADAITEFKKVFELNPAPTAELCLELGHLLAAAGDTDSALPMVERAATEIPTADSLGLHGELLLAAGKTQSAVDQLTEAVRTSPARADLQGALARALERRGDFEQSESAYRAAIRLDPGSADARNNLARLLLVRGQTVEAAAEARRAVAIRADFSQAQTTLADAVAESGQPDLALEHYRSALERDPRSTIAWDGLTRLLEKLGEFSALVNASKRWIGVTASATAYARLAAGYTGLDQLDDAIAAGIQACELDPGSADRWNELGMALKWAGRLRGGPRVSAGAKESGSSEYLRAGVTGDARDAISAFQRALVIDPNHADARGNLCYALLADDQTTAENILEAHAEWGRLHGILATDGAQIHTDKKSSSVSICAPSDFGELSRAVAEYSSNLKPPRNDRTSERRLRIGYVSPNFRSQAVMPFVLPILENHDPTVAEVYVYSDVTRPDAVTDRVKKVVPKFRDTAHLDDASFAAAVRSDRIDILVELTGHIGYGRLKAMAHRPAPVQVSYIGYQGTTGCRAIDYVLTDDHADPPGNERFYVEKPYRLGTPFFVYDPLGLPPLIGPRSAGPITFGCLNAVHKITPRTVRLWANILRLVPDSQMTVLAGGSKATADRLTSEFSAGGIAPARLSLLRRTDVRNYFRRYARIDIALDPLPMVGHTTTCDAAWMGVPTITRSGQIYAHRYGGSLNRAIGLGDLVAESDEAYVAAAVKLAADRDRLASFRSTLRSTLQRSCVSDGAGFTRRLESAYRDMWRTWCVGQKLEWQV